MPNSKIHYTWDQLHEDTYKICKWVRDVDFKPDLIVGVVRGGAIPAVIASHILESPVELVQWSLRDSKKQDFRKLDQLAISNKRILFIEDIVDSGDTMAAIKERMFDTKNRVLYTSLFFNPAQSKANIHHWTRVIDRSEDERWVVFPWEA